MTRIEDALQQLYGQTGRNLTAEGYEEHLHKLRKANPAAARRIERSLEPFLAERVFPRRKVKWHETSEGTCVRLALLPDNPHLRRDVIAIRSAFGIPDNQIKAREEDPEWQEMKALVKPQYIRKVLEGNWAAAWHFLHCQAALGYPKDLTMQENLPPSLKQSAISSSGVNLTVDTMPDWLRQPPNGPEPYTRAAAPVNWAAGRLVERHRLPWHAAMMLVFYILTENRSFLENIEPLKVDIAYDMSFSGDRDAFNITIKKVDEFVSKKDWDRVWDKIVRPRQEKIWEKRGIKPQGRRSADVRRLRKYLPLYRKLVEEGKTIRQVLADPAANEQDQETIRRVLADFSELLLPQI